MATQTQISSSTATPPADTPTKSIAPWWHTVLVLVPLAIGSVARAYQHGLENLHVPGLSSRFSSYVTVFLEEWFVVLLLWLALRRRGLDLGGQPNGPGIDGRAGPSRPNAGSARNARRNVSALIGCRQTRQTARTG